jgi:NodT family efflux transporter outer membrane factor (OMF) lipoprotein
VLAISLLVAHCNLAPEMVKPEVATPGVFKEAQPSEEARGWKTAEPMDDSIRTKWWELFQEPDLNALEEQVAAGNQNVAEMMANFLAARAVVKQNRSQYYPTITASASVTRLREAFLLSPSGTPPTPVTITEYLVPFDASWEPDLWGRIQNSVAASTSEAEASRADLANVTLSVQGEVAADYLQLRVLNAQKVLLDSASMAYGDVLELTQVQHTAGVASDQDVAQAQTALENARAQSVDLDIQRAQLGHALGTLLGKPDTTIAAPPRAGEPVMPAIPVGVPSRLLERRPDIAAAERRVAEANAQIGVARAGQFPTITLSASAGFQSTSIGNLFTASGLVWSVGAALAQTLFDAGKRSAITEQSWAVYQGTVAQYRQTVLTAFQEVEDNLSTIRILSQEQEHQAAACESARRSVRHTTTLYESGIDSYLDVASAQIALLSNQRTVWNLRLQQMTTRVQLIKALGGGWVDEYDEAEAMP